MQHQMLDLHMAGWIELAKEVVKRAASDYRLYLRSAKLHPHDEGLKGQMRDLEAFLRKGWFHDLLNIDGDALIERLKEEVHA